ncbi:MAG: serine hydrolase [Crocinitomicaceae bacterium]|nr:serine hydrolase [Crocinitomicaceae bacterium]
MKKKRTKRIIQVSLLVGTAISLFFVPWLLVWAWILPLPNTIQEQAEQAVDHGFEGVIIYVDQSNETPKHYTAGWHNREDKTPAKPDALFKIASISKLYTAVAVTKLVSDNRLSLNKSLSYYLPEIAKGIENSDEITIKMLVQHRSGIPNYTDTPDYWANPKESNKENLELILGKPAEFEPNDDYQYCNTNYLLLSMIMDKILNHPHFQYIQEEILTPLKLENTYASLSDVNMENVMSGYHLGHDPDLKNDEMGIVATAEDVGTFVKALNDGTLLNSNEQKIYSSIYEYKHSGWVPGYQSFVEYYEDIDAVVVEFYSTTDADLLLWNTAEIVNNRIVRIISEK